MAKLANYLAFLCLFSGILSGFPVDSPSAGLRLFLAIIAALDSGGYLIHKRLISRNTAHPLTGSNDFISRVQISGLTRNRGELCYRQPKQLDAQSVIRCERMNERVLAEAVGAVLLAVRCCPHGHR
jgi:hypothetical protein